MDKSHIDLFLKGLKLRKITILCILGLLLSFFMVFSAINSASYESEKNAFSLINSNRIFIICIPLLLLCPVEWILLKDRKLSIVGIIGCIIISALISMIVTVFTFFFAYFVFGWNGNYNIGDMILRMILAFLPYIRVSSFMVLLVIVFQNIYVPILFGLIEFVFVGIIIEPGVGFFYTTGVSNIIKIFTLDTSSIYTINPSNGLVFTIRYNTIFEGVLARETLVYSLIYAGLFVFLCLAYNHGYTNFMSKYKNREYVSKGFSKIINCIPILPALVTNLALFFVPFDKYFIGFFAGALIISFCLIINKSVFRKLVIGSGTIVIILSLFICFKSPFYNSLNFVDEFEHVFSKMKDKYILSELKKIDWDSLYGKYYPKFDQANKSRNYIERYKLYRQLGQEFYDGHVDLSLKASEGPEYPEYYVYGNDYGLSLLRLDSGEYVAINVEGDLNSYSVYEENIDGELSVPEDCQKNNLDERRSYLINSGIHNGTVILSWNGMSIDDVCKYVDVNLSVYADEENRIFYLPVHAAGIGNESVTIKYIDDDGNVKNARLYCLGQYYFRLKDSIKKLNQGIDVNNLEWVDISKRTVALRVLHMTYNGDEGNAASYAMMKDWLREDIIRFQKEGKKNIILDLRDNSGGSPLMSLELASLFAPEREYVLGYSVKLDKKTLCFEKGLDGKFIPNEKLSCFGENLWGHGNIIVLVNNNTVSAGDIFTYVMSDFPNVTIMGITGSNSSSQAVMVEYLNDSCFRYSAIPFIDNLGNILIDTNEDHISNVPIDIKIPATGELVKEIFDESEDYILKYALNFLEQD